MPVQEYVEAPDPQSETVCPAQMVVNEGVIETVGNGVIATAVVVVVVQPALLLAVTV